MTNETKSPAQAAPVVAASELSDEQSTFAAWLAREMPAGTVIGDPAWWAPRILRAVLAQAAPVAALPQGMRITLTGDRYPVEVWAEPCMQGEFPPHAFALHHLLAAEDMLDVTSFVVTHLGTGRQVARAESIKAALALARKRIGSISPEEFNERCENAKRGVLPAAPAPGEES
jgi:hypothetical protein